VCASVSGVGNSLEPSQESYHGRDESKISVLGDPKAVRKAAADGIVGRWRGDEGSRTGLTAI
jgi:hypothetical protein